MNPISETEEVDRQYGPFSFRGDDLLEHLVDLSHRVEALAPDCVGISLSVEAEQGMTFTLECTPPRRVATSLGLELLSAGEALGDLTLYGATPDAFDDVRRPLVEALGAHPLKLRVDEDLEFASRERARGAPEQVMESTYLSLAVALVSRVRTLPFDDAELRLRSVAAEHAVPVMALARSIISILSDA